MSLAVIKKLMNPSFSNNKVYPLRILRHCRDTHTVAPVQQSLLSFFYSISMRMWMVLHNSFGSHYSFEQIWKETNRYNLLHSKRILCPDFPPSSWSTGHIPIYETLKLRAEVNITPKKWKLQFKLVTPLKLTVLKTLESPRVKRIITRSLIIIICKIFPTLYFVLMVKRVDIDMDHVQIL